MRFSKAFLKTVREFPKDETAINARLLIKAGFIAKLMAGVYNFLPLGLRVLSKIENIVREEMNKIGGQEILMQTLHPKELWERTGRWKSFDVLFKIAGRSGGEYALGPTHEEILYPLAADFVDSYRDLPLYLYQIQTKFRDEPRAKSGLLRNREFRMKDLYSFHADDQDRDRYYETVKAAYLRIFKRLGLEAIETKASGGSFSEESCEFQVISPAGEDSIFFCHQCHIAVNKELGPGGQCPQCGNETKEEKSIEVGNVFPLKEKFARDFNLVFKDKNGKKKFASAGCYGFGTTRAMGTIAEVHHDENGLIWPAAVAPYDVELVDLGEKKSADGVHDDLIKAGLEVLYDDRDGVSAGEKFKDADLIGIPWRLVVSEKTVKAKKIEIKKREENSQRLVSLSQIVKIIDND